jgi:hypothetical protein
MDLTSLFGMGNVMVEFLIGVTLGVVVSILVFGSAIASEVNHSWETETVARGLAMHCPTNGVWAWNGECK